VTLAALLAALLVWVLVIMWIGRPCGAPIDNFPTRMLALQFARSVEDGRRVLSESCTERTIANGQYADVPFIVLYVLAALVALQRLTPFIRARIVPALAAASMAVAGVYDLLEDASILRIAGLRWIPDWVSSNTSAYGVTKWALFYSSSLLLAVALSLAAAGATQRTRRIFAAAVPFAAVAGGRLWALATTDYDRMFFGLAFWFLSLVIIAANRDPGETAVEG
jgi:hypothetical protein